MGQVTAIQWTDHTFNPWRGCTKISPGCTNCYAETLSHRNPKTLGVWGDKGTRVIASDSTWRQPAKWNRQAMAENRRHRVFCASLADVFEDRPELDQPRQRLFTLIQATPWLDWQLLTKRPENMLRMVLDWKHFPNIWAMTSVENQEYADRRIPELLKVPAAVRGLSVEPLLGPVKLPIEATADGHINWVIIGGESGPHARPCYVDWVRDLVRQCHAAGAACFVKQLGHHISESGRPGLTFADHKGGDPSEWPQDLRIRQFP